jgi:hypothetical protein
VDEETEPTIEERVDHLEHLVQRLIDALKLTNAALLKTAGAEKPKSAIIMPELMQ